MEIGPTGLTDSNGTNPLTFTDGSLGNYTSNPTGESTSTTVTAYDSLGTPVSVDITTVLESSTAAGQTWRFFATSGNNSGANTELLGNGTLTFNNTGTLESSTGTAITLSRNHRRGYATNFELELWQCDRSGQFNFPNRHGRARWVAHRNVERFFSW